MRDPEESVEKLQDFWKAIYETAMAINPDAVIEICPCGDSFAFHNIPAMNNTPASDPDSSWQVRLKGKTFKALMGPSAPYAGDHVELSDGGDDFASTYGIGGIPRPSSPGPRTPTSRPTSFRPAASCLPAEGASCGANGSRSTARTCCPRASISASSTTSVSTSPRRMSSPPAASCTMPFTPKHWNGPIALRGLGRGSIALTNSFTGEPLGSATAADNSINAQIRQIPPRRGGARRSDGMTTTAPAPSGRAWLIYALITVVLWGVWGAFADLSRQARLPGHAGLLRVGADDDPAGASSRCAWAAGKLELSGRAIAYGMAIGLLGAGGQMLLFYALTTGPGLSHLSDHLAVAAWSRSRCRSRCLRERTGKLGALGIVLALLALPMFDYAPRTAAQRAASDGSCWRWS